MTRSFSLFFVLGCVSVPLQAAVVVTSDTGGELSTQYFEKGEYVLMRDEKPSMGVDREGNCWFVQHRRVISDPCAQMLQSVNAIREQAMAGLSAEDRAMMERALKMQSAAQPASVIRSADRKIAGYIAECHLIGSDHEVCVSKKLLQEIGEEMGDSPFLEVFRRFGESSGEMGGDTPETKALAELVERGFPMLDLRKVVAASGLDPALLQYLPESQRTEIMRRMNVAGGEKLRGTKVVRVDKDGEMPELDLSRYPRVGFEQFMQQSMERTGGMMRSR